MDTIKKTYTVLSEDDVLQKAPVVATKTHSSNVSGEYQQYPTLLLVKILMGLGWEAIEARQTRTRVKKYRGFQRHLVRFVHPQMSLGTDELMSIVLINSHDGRCSYKLYSGIFRLVCSNGAIVGWTKYIVRLTHRWHSSWEVQMLTRTIADSSSEIADRIDVLKKRMLLPDEKTQFAKDTLKMLYKRTGDKTRLQHVDEILIPKRDEDIGDSVWTVMNVIQENGMRGYVYHDKRLGQRKGRVMTSIAREVQFNTDITQLAWERFGT